MEMTFDNPHKKQLLMIFFFISRKRILYKCGYRRLLFAVAVADGGCAVVIGYGS